MGFCLCHLLSLPNHVAIAGILSTVLYAASKYDRGHPLSVVGKTTKSQLAAQSIQSHSHCWHRHTSFPLAEILMAFPVHLFFWALFGSWCFLLRFVKMTEKKRGHSRHLLYTIGLSFFSISLWAQQIVRGEIRDADSQRPIPFAAVSVLNTSPPIGAMADADGYFVLSGVPLGKRSFVFSPYGI